MSPRALVRMILLLLSCGPRMDHGALRDYVEETFGGVSLEEVSVIFAITEEGCPVCDRRFADLLRSRTDCAQCLFIIRSQGSAFGLKGFLEERPNLRFDDGAFKRLGLLEGSGVVLLREGRIQGIEPLRVETIDEQLARFAALLDSLAAGGAW